jgi:hypothetical protein
MLTFNFLLDDSQIEEPGDRQEGPGAEFLFLFFASKAMLFIEEWVQVDTMGWSRD